MPIESPSVREYLMQKMKEREDLKNQLDADASGPNWSAGLQALGAGIAGGNAAQVGQAALQQQSNERKQKLSDFDSQTDGYLKNQEVLSKADLSDPMSQKSMAFRKAIEANFPSVAKAYGQDWANVSAADQENIMQPLRLKETIEGRKQQAAILAGQRDQIRQDKAEKDRLAAEAKAAERGKLSDKQIEAFTDLDNAKSDLNNLLTELGNNSDWTGKVDGAFPDWTIDDKQVAWRSALGKYKDAYRKAVTGTGASPTEIATLERRLPSEYDQFDNFKAKANEALNEIERRKKTLGGNLSKAGKNVSAYITESPERIPVRQERNKKTGEIRTVFSDGSTEPVHAVTKR